MSVLRKDEEDWWFARHSDGRDGSIPVPHVQVREGERDGERERESEGMSE